MIAVRARCAIAAIESSCYSFSRQDPDTIIEAYEEGKKPQPKPGKKSRRQNKQKSKIEEAKKIVADTTAKLGRSMLQADLLDDMVSLLKDDLDFYYHAFKKSKYMELYACARMMEQQVRFRL